MGGGVGSGGLELEQGGNLTYCDHSEVLAWKIPCMWQKQTFEMKAETRLKQRMKLILLFKSPADKHMCPVFCFPDIRFPLFEQNFYLNLSRAQDRHIPRLNKMGCVHIIHIWSACCQYLNPLKQKKHCNGTLQSLELTVLFRLCEATLATSIFLCVVGFTLLSMERRMSQAVCCFLWHL